MGEPQRYGTRAVSAEATKAVMDEPTVGRYLERLRAGQRRPRTRDRRDYNRQRG